MVREDRVIMSVKELRRVHVICQTREQKLTQVKAATLLGLTTRHIRRLIERVAQAGDSGLAHRGRGKPSNRRISEQVKTKALKLYEKQYGDFGPTLAAEKLAERHGITLSDETLRGWLLATGVTHFQRRTRPHRAWRERTAHRGELVQLDGSHHDWFEGRGPRCVLMAYIDDASSRVYARFYGYEGTIPAMASFTRYVMQYGVPLAIYADKHTTYQSPVPPTLDEQLAGVTPTSQFGRALGELGVELIPAHSPQAKGRVERLFQTLQDRVIKEMRLADVSTLDAANQFLAGYLPIYNQRFTVQPTQVADLHRPRPASRDLDRSLCIKTTRCLRKDFTIAHQGGLDQIHETVRAPRVLVEEHGDGTMRITHQGRALDFHAITSRPMKAAEARRFIDHGARSRRGRTIRGASACGQNVQATRRRSEHKTGHFYFGRKRTFLNWVDRPAPSCRPVQPGVKITRLLVEGEPMPNIVLLVSPSCGACPSAKSLWKQLRTKYSFSYREVDITTEDGRGLADRHSVRAVPATIIDGRLTFVGVPSRESAEKALLLKMKPRE